MPDTVDTREEQQLLDAVKKANDLVGGGMSPNAAVEKVARDAGLGPGKIRLIGQAYNTGQQLAQFRTKQASILDKLASFTLCDPEAVIDSIYNGPTPGEKAAADRVDAAYARRPVFAHQVHAAREKTASYKLPGTGTEKQAATAQPRIEVAYGNINRAKQAYDEGRRRAASARDAVMTKVAHIVTYFRKQASTRLPFHHVEATALAYMGDGAKSLMDTVAQRLPFKEKRAADVKAGNYGPVNLRAEPFTLISSALDTAVQAFQLAKQAEDLKAAYAKAQEDQLRPFAVAAGKAAQPEKSATDAIFGVGEKRAFGIIPEIGAIAAGDILAHKATHGPENAEDPFGDVTSLDNELDMIRRQSQQAIGMRRKPREKKAFLGPGLGAAIGSSIGRTMGTVTKTRGDLVDDAWMGLEDPEHENELRKIKAHAMINQLLTDPDDPISGHDPDKVLAAYNEISQAAPRVAENAATLRPALRKRLMGHTEPFESKELLDIEHGLAKTKMPTPNTSILGGDTPDGLLG